MDAVRKQEPRLERTVQALGEQHCHLAQALEALTAKSRSARSLDTGLREEVRRWIDQVRQHEIKENAVVFEAFNLDIGTKD